jgi:asparagine N-glycosylation enzyme membrane subunit Stt3
MQSDLSANTHTGQTHDSTGQPEARQAKAERKEPASMAANQSPAAQQRSEGASKMPRKDFRHRAGKAVSYVRGTWLGRNWYTVTILFFLVVLGLFVRSYFGVQPATEDGFLLSGGSDSYYHQRAYVYAYETGHHLHLEDMLNYPMGTRNPRAPIYDWSIVIGGQALSPLFGGDAIESMWWVFIFSTAFWGAITVIPTYFLAKEAFGKKAGYIAGFLIAIMPGHIQRSVLTNADHDAISLFFIVTAFYFFLKALKNLKAGGAYVESWRNIKGVASGLRRMVGENRVSALFALLAGFSFLVVALTWQGYAYMLVIVTLYFALQLLVNRFRNVDSLGVIMVYGISVGTISLLAFPYYYLSFQIASWYDAPTYMFLGALAFGLTLEVTRKYPWLLVLSLLTIGGIVAVLSLFLFWHSMYNTLIGAIASGAGYFVRNKQYETIAEAQAPPFSNLAMSFGVMTFWLSLVGIGYAIYQLPKKLKFDYIFIVVWAATSIYMAVSAARFMFNAAPAFAVTAGWIVAIIIAKLDLRGALEQQRRNASGFSNDWAVFQSSFAVGLIIGISGFGAYLYMDSLAPLAIAAVALMTLAYSVYAYGMRAKWYFHVLGLLPLAITLLLYVTSYNGFHKTADHVAIPLLTGFVLAILVVQLRGMKLRTTAGVLFLAFLVVLPNVWAGVDAGIPYEVKAQYDKNIYDAVPSAFTPASYDAKNGTNWYLGGFGYSLPLNTRYYPAAYDWLATQDNGIYPPENRPAYLSWWDYGFEAVNEGQHPTVADNFLGGHQLAGNFIMSQNESNAVSLLIMRIIGSDYIRNRNSIKWDLNVDGYLSPGIRSTLESHGLDPDAFVNMIENPKDYIETIQAHPEIYSPRDSVIQDANAQDLAGMAYISTTRNLDGVISLYHDIRAATGWSIRYFAIDSRLFPFSGDNTGIFYAPAKLSDHRIKDPNQPYDFFEIKAVGEYGGEYALEDVPKDVNIVSYKLEYKDMFFNTMLYKCFVGYGGKDIGGTNADGIPGINGTLESKEPMPGWNMTHFRRVYRTAYYNPYPANDIANHTDAWQAMNYDDAAQLQQDIQAGKATGVVDGSARSSLYQGVSFLKYYDGAIVTGTVTLPDGTPVGGAHATMYDEYGIPHNIVRTDANGKYSLLAPFGNVTVVISTGALTLETLVGTQLNSTSFYVRDDQAMREEQDRDADGVWDYYIQKDLTVKGSYLSGQVYSDGDANGAYSSGDMYVPGALVTITSVTDNSFRTLLTDSEGRYNFTELVPGSYTTNVSLNGYEFVSATSVEVGGTASGTKDFPVKAVRLSGYVMRDNMAAVANATVAISDEIGGIVDVLKADQNGYFNGTFPVGRYYLRSGTDTGLWSQLRFFELKGTTNVSVNVTVYKSAAISGYVTAGGRLVSNATITFHNLHKLNQDAIIRGDWTGGFSDFLPLGEYSVYATYTSREGNQYAYLQPLMVDGELVNLTFDMARAGRISGVARDATGLALVNAALTFNGATAYDVATNSTGGYSALLPAGDYSIYLDVRGRMLVSLTEVSVPAAGRIGHDLATVRGVMVSGKVETDNSGSGQNATVLEFSSVTYTSSSGIDLPIYVDSSGSFSGIVPSNEVYMLTARSAGYLPMVYGPITAVEVGISNTFAMSGGNIAISGEVIPESPDLPVGGHILNVLSANGQVLRVPILSDGTFLMDLAPGVYEASMNGDLTGNGSMDLVYQLLIGTLRLDIGPGTKDTTLKFQAVKRARVNITVENEGENVSATITFTGTENFKHTIVNPDGESVYLRPGQYSLLGQYMPKGANASVNEKMVLDNITVDSSRSLVLNLSDSRLVKGTVIYKVSPISGLNVSLTDTLTGMTMPGLTDATGKYEIRAIPGRNYTLSVNQTLNETEGLAMRYYEYSARKQFNASVGTDSIQNLELVRAMDNTTISGAILGAAGYGSQTIDFLAADASAITARTKVDDTGRFSASLAPGNYVFYAYDSAEKKAAIGKINVTTADKTDAGIQMAPGLKLSGDLYLRDSTPVETNITIAIGPLAKLKVFSSSGYYEIWLPKGTYNLSAERKVVEYEKSVVYKYNASVVLSSNLRYNIPLARQNNYGARIDWDSTQNVPVAPGANQTYSFSVTNTGNLVDTFVMNVLGDDGWTLTLSKQEVTLIPGASMAMTLNMTIPDYVKVQHIPVTVTVESKNNAAGAAVSKAMEVNTTQRHAISITPSVIPPVETKDKFSFSVSVMNSGNGNDAYDISIANIDDLTEKGWSIDWSSSSSLGGAVNGTDLKGVPVASNASAEIKFSLVRNQTGAVPPGEVIVYVRSANDPNTFDTYALEVRSGAVVLGANMPSASGDLAVDVNPATGHLTDAIGAFAAVGIILATYYYMRRRRWLS